MPLSDTIRMTPEELTTRFYELYEHYAPSFDRRLKTMAPRPVEDIPTNERKLMGTVLSQMQDEIRKETAEVLGMKIVR